MLWNHLDLFNTRRRFLLVLWAKPGAPHWVQNLHMARWMFGWPMACNCSVTRASNLCALASWKLITTVHVYSLIRSYLNHGRRHFRCLKSQEFRPRPVNGSWAGRSVSESWISRGMRFFTVAVNVYPCIGVSGGAWAIIEECREIDKQRRRPPG